MQAVLSELKLFNISFATRLKLSLFRPGQLYSLFTQQISAPCKWIDQSFKRVFNAAPLLNNILERCTCQHIIPTAKFERSGILKSASY